MVRTLLIIIGLFAIAAGFEWLKDEPGELALTIGGSIYSIGLAEAALLIAIVAVVSVVVYLVLRLIWVAPGRALFAWRDRKAERGRAAISRGLLAIAAGDLRQAELAAKEAARRAPDAPLTALLQAQAAQLKGDRDSAGATFTAMLDNPATRIAGLHGLFVEAERQGAAEAARHYARTAYDARPETSWAVRALLRYQAGAGDWDAALATLSSAANTRAIDKKQIRAHRAVLLTAKAMACEDTDTANARHASLEAHQLAPDLAPAAIVAGRILARAGEVKRAAKVLEDAWKEQPHPEIADAYAHVRSGDSALDRMARMEKLMRMKPHHDEGRMAFAAAAIEAREFEAARDALKPIITTRPTRNALILMAELDEAEHGDRGRVREWLDRAVRAPRDPVWTADGIILDEWAPVSPVSGRIGAVEWKLPVDEGENRLSIDMDDEAFKPREFLPLAAAAPAAAADMRGEADEGDFVDVTPAAGEAAAPGGAGSAAADATPAADSKAGSAAEAAPAEADAPLPQPPEIEPASGSGERAAQTEDRPLPVNAAAADDAAGGRGGDRGADRAVAPAGAADSAAEHDAASEGPAGDAGEAAEPEAAESAAQADGDVSDEEAEDEEGEDEEAGDEQIMPLIPDDPGVDETEEPEPRGFRLF